MITRIQQQQHYNKQYKRHKEYQRRHPHRLVMEDQSSSHYGYNIDAPKTKN